MLQVHRLATLLCKLYILASSFHWLTYKGIHRLYIVRLEASFYAWEHFLIQSLPLILNRFCLVFQFRLYVRGSVTGQYILFHRIYCQNNSIGEKAFERQGYWRNGKLGQRYIHCNATQHVSTKCFFEYCSMYRISLRLLRCRC